MTEEQVDELKAVSADPLGTEAGELNYSLSPFALFFPPYFFLLFIPLSPSYFSISLFSLFLSLPLQVLKPMMLRRLKVDVEKSLAPKEETIIEVSTWDRIGYIYMYTFI